MYVKIIVYAPKQNEQRILKKLFSLGAGKFGNYDSYSFVSYGITTYRALKTATPAIGKKNKSTKIKEVRIETVCREKDYKKIMQQVKKIHPYEEPAFCIYKIKDISMV